MKFSRQQYVFPVIILSVTLFLYHIILGINTLNPYYVGWLLVGGDWPAQYIGWEFFRKTPFTYPFGETWYYLFPFKSSVGFSDIPLAAFFFKPISLLTPELPFQYLGIWFFSCFFLNFIMSFKFCKSYIRVPDAVNLIFGAILAFSPVLIFRLGHPGLCCHWLIVWFLLLFVKASDSGIGNKSILSQGIIIILFGALIAPYFIVMFLVLYTFLLLLFLVKKEVNILMAVRNIVFIGAIIYACWDATGFFSYEINKSPIIGHTFRNMSLNLNSFINPLNNSSILNSLPLNNTYQYEGFGYLGMGIIYLVIINIARRIYYGPSKNLTNEVGLNMKFLWIACFILLFLAVTNKVTFGEYVLLEFKSDKNLDDIMERFRSCGRFAWPLYYLLMAYIVKNTLESIKNTKWVIGTSCIILAVQIFDAKQSVQQHRLNMENKLFISTNKEWDPILKNKKHLMLYPPFQHAYTHSMDFVNLSNLCLKYDLTINTGYVARVNQDLVNVQIDTLTRQVQYGMFDTSQVWVTNDQSSPNFTLAKENGIVNEKIIDGYHVYTVINPKSIKEKRFFSTNVLGTKGQKLESMDGSGSYFHSNVGFADHLVFGPYYYFRKGKYKVDFLIKASDVNTNDLIFKVAATSDFSKLVHAERDIYFKDLEVKNKDTYSLVSIVFDSDKNMNNFEFLLWSSGKSELTFKGLFVEKLD